MRENPIPLLILFCAIAALPTLAQGQENQDTPPTEREAQRVELARIKQLTARGPHRKNPLAAGRMLVLNAEHVRKERILRRRIANAERRTRRSTFTSLRYQEPAARPVKEDKEEDQHSG